MAQWVGVAASGRGSDLVTSQGRVQSFRAAPTGLSVGLGRVEMALAAVRGVQLDDAGHSERDFASGYEDVPAAPFDLATAQRHRLGEGDEHRVEPGNLGEDTLWSSKHLPG